MTFKIDSRLIKNDEVDISTDGDDDLVIEHTPTGERLTVDESTSLSDLADQTDIAAVEDLIDSVEGDVGSLEGDVSSLEDQTSGLSEDGSEADLSTLTTDQAEIAQIKHVTPEEHNSGERTIQDASDELADAGVTGSIELAPDGDYLVDTTQTVDARHVRQLDGNGARIKVTSSDVTAIKLQGTWTANSEARSYEPAEYQAEVGPVVTNLHIYSEEIPFVGTGIELENVFAPRINDCHLFNLDVGVTLSNADKVRNALILSNQIYDCDIGVLLENEGNCHQMLLSDNYIGYCRKHLFCNDFNIADLLMVGNNIESGQNNAGDDPEHWLHFIQDVTPSANNKFIANHFERHEDMTGFGVKVEGDQNVSSWQFHDNFFRPYSGAIQVDSPDLQLYGWKISNNTFTGEDATVDINCDRLYYFDFVNNSDRQSSGQTLRISPERNSDSIVVCNNNNFDVEIDYPDTGINYLRVGGNNLRSLAVNGDVLSSSQITNNVLINDTHDADDLPIFDVSIDTTLAATTVSDNTVIGQTLSNGPSDAFAMAVEGGVIFQTVQVNSNTVRGFDGDSSGLKVSGGTAYSGIIKNNMVRNVNTTALDLIESWDNAGVTKDNIDAS